MAVTVSQSPCASSFACVAFLVVALAGSAVGQGASIDDVVLSGIPPAPVTLGSTDAVSFTCTVNVTCNGTCTNEMPTIIWRRNTDIIMGVSDGYILSTPTSMSSNDMQSADFISTLSVDGAVSTTHAGRYMCGAELNGSGMDSMEEGILTVQIPPPSANLTSSVVLIGSPATLQCTVMLHSSLNCSGPVTATVELVSTSTTPNPAIDTQTATGSGSTCDAVSLNIPSSMVGTSGGQYNCHVQLNYTAANSAFVMNPNQSTSDPATLYVVGSTAMATPSTVLDVSPYNNFSLICSVSVNPTTIPTIIYQWTGDNVTQPNASNTTASATAAGSSSYQCNATVMVSMLNPVVTSDTTTVTVRGPSFPDVPVNVTASPTAVIFFVITNVTYTPETYTVRYGDSPSNLNMNSNNTATSGGVDSVHSFITTVNERYSIMLTGLSIDTTYYYQVVATNTIGNTTTSVFNFTTAEAPPGPPSNLRLVPIDSTSLRFSWEMPTQPNGVVIGYNYSCTQTESAEEVARDTTNSNITSVVLTGLSPFTNYTCSVSASTSAGTGAAAIQTGITNMTAPNSPPDNFTITSSSSTVLTLQWQAPVRPNGIITQYRYSCTQAGVRGEGGEGGVFTGNSLGDNTTSMMTASVTRLTPYTRYNCSVYASTSIGEGPGISGVGTTGEDVPGRVENFQVRGVSPNTFNILWRSPSIDNGNITVYTITVTNYTNGIIVYRDNQTAVTNDDDESYMYNTSSLSQIEPLVPYNVSITASTTAGEGPAETKIDFTQQGSPLPVQNVMATRINNTAIRVSWSPLTLPQARGFLTGYTITITPTPISRKRQTNGAVTAMAGPTDTSIVVTGLNPTLQYSVTVAGGTSVGIGETGPPVTPEPLSPVPGTSVTAVPSLVPATSATPVPADGMTAVIVAVVVVGVLLVLVLVVVLVILTLYFMRTKKVKLHTLTVQENESALVITDGDESRNGKGIELKAMEKMDEAILKRCTAVPVEDFTRHCAKLHFNRDLGFEEEYETFKNIPKNSFMIAKLPANANKNRFENVYSYDDARVKLPEVEGVSGSDYINASYMNGYNKENAYIAAQGPLPQTVGDFWRMVWELKLPTIVMLTELIERGIEKCHCYWPKNINTTLDVGYGLKVTLVEQKAFVEYKYKEIVVVNSNDTSSKPLKVTHYHFTAWPDHGVPADKTCMLAFIKRVRKTHPVGGPPLLVHCSAGVGRTGTFIVLDTTVQRMKAEGTLNIYELITDMRKRRVLMVQTEAQYVYIHDALQEYIVCGDTSIPAEKIRNAMVSLQKVSDHKSGYQKQFELLNEVSIKPLDSYCSDALTKENVEKNRYPQRMETLPYNNTRVKFRTMTGIGGGAKGEGGGGNYVNASHVDGYKHRGAFLATQTPLEDTIEDFWHMLWETQSKAIVMLCNLDEQEETKYPQYWPTKIGEVDTYGKLKVKWISEKQHDEYVVRKFELSLVTEYINLGGGGEDQFVVTQFHYTKWPEQGKPSTPTGMIKLMDDLLKVQRNVGNKSITVACSDGVGRTGAFACIYSQLERVKTEALTDVFQYIKGSRFQRNGLVQTLDQYIFCHEVVGEFLSSFDNYHNFQGEN